MNQTFFRANMTATIYVRSNLFTLKPKLHRTFLKNYPLVCAENNFEFLYTGELLTQFDRDVELAIKRLFIANRHNDLGAEIYFGDIFKQLRKKNYGKNDMHLLFESLNRKAKTIYAITENNNSFEGCPFNKFTLIPEAKKLIMEINEKWIDFCDHLTFSPLNYQQRLILSPGFTRWLHGYWSSFAIIPETNVAELRMFCGSKEKLIGNFKKIIINSLKQLTEINFIAPDWNISRNGNIKVNKK